uniref:Putative 16.8 kDa salivary secreted protein n=1 Tax=Psorophora albipes TaxID=869069 RepID=T1DF68_9DIPT
MMRESRILGSSCHQRVVILLLLVVVGVSYACNGGYRIKVRKVQNCAGGNAIMVAQENFTAVLTKNCEVKSRGCVTFKSFRTATAKYKVKKDGVVLMNGQIDLCERLAAGSRDQNLAPLIRTFGLPTSCPVQAGTICTDPSQVIDIERFKRMLPLVRGRIDMESEIQHDTGRSCFRVQFDVTK